MVAQAMSKALTSTRDREIRVTPEMIEAGADVLAGYSDFFYPRADWARWVYEAMRRADRRKSSENPAA